VVDLSSEEEDDFPDTS
jgi:hypothetical protein